MPLDCVRDAGMLCDADRKNAEGDPPESSGDPGGKGVRSTGKEIALRVGDFAGTSIGCEEEASFRGGGSPSSSSPPERASAAAIQFDRAVFSRQRMPISTGVVGTMPGRSGERGSEKEILGIKNDLAPQRSGFSG